ncbi:MAG: HupE/UreJ family protein [Planctomycetota bacterium]
MSLALAVLSLPLLAPATVSTHAVGEDYLFINFRENVIEGHFEIHADDLAEKLGIEIDRDNEGEEAAKEDVIEQAAAVQAYITANYKMQPEGGQPYTFNFTHQDLIALPQGSFAQYHFEVPIEALPDRIEFEHSMFYDGDNLHRGLLLVEYNHKTNETFPDEYTSLVFSPNNREQTLDLNDIPTIMKPWDMVPQGVLHIWIGIDHILFLLALMLPIVLTSDKERKPVESFKAAFFNLLKIVTVFTIAHSVTLILAGLDFVAVPSRIVESIIALSIMLVALNNIFGKVRDGALWVILGLGLFHGLGFASVMGVLPFRMVDILKIVIGFNIGVELGQLAIVAVLFPILFLLRKASWYKPVILKGGSVVLMLIAGWWFIERAFDLG